MTKHPTDYLITLRVRSDAPIAVLRDPRAYSQTVIDTKLGSHFMMVIERAEAREIEPWEEAGEQMDMPLDTSRPTISNIVTSEDFGMCG